MSVRPWVRPSVRHQSLDKPREKTISPRNMGVVSFFKEFHVEVPSSLWPTPKNGSLGRILDRPIFDPSAYLKNGKFLRKAYWDKMRQNPLLYNQNFNLEGRAPPGGPPGGWGQNFVESSRKLVHFMANFHQCKVVGYPPKPLQNFDIGGPPPPWGEPPP